MWPEVAMETRKRKLIFSNVHYGTPMGGWCSRCQKRFNVELGSSEALSEAKERLMVLFERHVCIEPSNSVVAPAV